MRNLEKYFEIEKSIKNEYLDEEKLVSFLNFYNVYIKDNLEESKRIQKKTKKFISLLLVSFLFAFFMYITKFNNNFVFTFLCANVFITLLLIIYKILDVFDKKDSIKSFFERLEDSELENKKQETVKKTLSLIVKDKNMIKNKIKNLNLELSKLENNLDIEEVEIFLEKNKNNKKELSKIKALTEKIYNYEENQCKRLYSEVNSNIYDIKKMKRETIQTI